MAPNSRPPLTSRIRASFDGKRTKSEVTSPIHTNGFIAQDPETLRSAIDDAINSEIFHKAIAANLAKLIKPSIKSALDTIQPVVEAVYSHELLLRKTNQSVEDILLRLDSQGLTASRRESIVEPLGPEPNDGAPIHTPPGEGERGGKTPTQEIPEPRARAVSTSSPDGTRHKELLEGNHAKITSSLAQLSGIVEASNSKIAEALQGISVVDTKLRWTSDSMETLKSASEQSHTTMAVLQAQLDQLNQDIGQLMTVVGTDLGKNVQALTQQGGMKDTSLFDAHTSKLDLISTDIAALKGHSETVNKVDAVSTELASLKATVENGLTSNSTGFLGLGGQITTVLTTLESHTGTLDEIKPQPPHPEILTALQQSNDSHASHALSLSELKNRSLPEPTESNPDTDTTTALQDLKSDLASLRENIEAGFASNNENVSSVGSKVDIVLTTIEGHKASNPSADILAAVQQANVSHAAHAVVLGELKEREVPAITLDTTDLNTKLDGLSEMVSGHTAVLDEIKSREIVPVAGVDTSDLTAKLDSLSETIHGHIAVLDDLKSREIAPATSLDTSDLTTKLDTLSETIHGHTATLDEIKAASGSHSAALESHGNALEGLRSINPAPVPESVAETEVSNIAPLEAHMSSIVSILEEHSEALNEIKTHTGAHTSALESHETALEEIKSLSRDVPQTPVVDNSGLEAQVAGLATTLESHTSALDEIKASGSAHASALEGLRFPDSAPGVTNDNLAALETQIGSILSTLNNQPKAIKSISPQPRAISETTELVAPSNGLGDIMTTIVETLEMHTTLLNEMKEDVSAEILTTLHDLSQTQSNQNNLLAEIREADVSDEILTLLHATGESHASHTVSLDKILAANESHGGVLEELKSRNVEPVSAPAPATVDISGVETKIDNVINVLDEHKAALAEIKDTASASHELHASHGAVLEEIKSRSVESSPGAAVDLSGLESQLGAITASLEEHKASLAEVKELHTAHGASLDEIKSRSIESVPPPATDLSGLDAQLAAISATLEEHKATLAEVKDLHAAHGTSLDEIEARSIDAAPAPATDLSGLETQLSAISAALEEHKSTLADVKTTTLASQILHTVSIDSIKALALSPASSAPAIDISSLEAQMGSINSSIDEIKAKSLEPAASAVPVDLSGLETQLAGLANMLEEHKATLSEVKETSMKSQDMQAAHATSLDEIKARSIVPETNSDVDLSGLEAQLTAIAEKLDEHKAMLSTHTSFLGDIKDASLASNESYSAHTAALSDIKDATSSWNEAHSANAFTLAEIKDATLASNESHLSHAVALSGLKDATSQANESHASHAAAFSELKSVQPAENTIDFSLIEGQLTTIIDTLEAQNATLAEIKEISSHPEILANISDLKSLVSETHAEHDSLVKDLHSETKDSHSHLASTLESLALGGAAGAGATASLTHDDYESSEKLLSEIRSTLTTTKSTVDSIAAQIDINHTTNTTSITTLSDELKAEIDATGTHVTDHILSLSSELKSKCLDIAPIAEGVKMVESKIDGLEGSVKQTGSFVVGLYEGVHLNDTGVGQLQEQLVTWVVEGRGELGGIETPPVSMPVAVPVGGSRDLGESDVGDVGAGESSDKEAGLQVPMEIDEAAWFNKKRDSKRGVSPSPLREMETVSPPVEKVEEDEEGGEEEMPSIETMLEKDVLPVVAGAAVVGVVAVGAHEMLGDEKEEASVEEPAAEEKEVPVESEDAPADGSKEVEEAAPEQPMEESKEIEADDTLVDDAPIPEPTTEDVPAEAEIPEEKEVEESQEIAEESAESLEESAPLESEPVAEEAKDEEPLAIEPEPTVEEADIAETAEEPSAIEDEVSHGVDEHVPTEIEEPAIHIADDESPAEEEVEEAKEEEPVVPEDVEEASSLADEPVESKEVEESTPVGAEDSGVLESEDVPVESEATESKDSEEPTPNDEDLAVERSNIPEAEEESAALEPEATEPLDEEPQAEVVEPSHEESLPVESEEPIENEKEVEEVPSVEAEPEAISESNAPEPVEETAAVESKEPIEHTKDIEESHNEPEILPDEPPIVSEEPSEDTTELGEEIPRDPEPTPADPTTPETLAVETSHEEEHVSENIHQEHENLPATEDQSEAGGASIEESPVAEESHNEAPSSPFVEDPEYHPPPHFEHENSHEEDPTALDFEEPHPSSISEHHPSSLIHSQVIEDSEDEGIPLSHEHVEEPLESPVESHAVPHSGMHDEEEQEDYDEEDANPFKDPENMLPPSDMHSMVEDADGSVLESHVEDDEVVHHGHEEAVEEVEEESVGGVEHEPTHGADIDHEEDETSPKSVVDDHVTHVQHDFEEDAVPSKSAEEDHKSTTHHHEDEEEVKPHTTTEHEPKNEEPEPVHATPPHAEDDKPDHTEAAEEPTPTPHHDTKSTPKDEDKDDEEDSSPAFSGGFA